MARIVEVTPFVTRIGLDEGELFDISTESLSFKPYVGQEVEVYRSEFKTVIHPKAIPNRPHEVNKIAYALLAIFLGFLGLHKFYAGYTGRGLLYLLFSWTFLPGLIAFIEGIVALTRQADDRGCILV